MPHATVSQFSDLPYPLRNAFAGQGEKKLPQIKAVVLDKDDCFAYPETNVVHPPYTERFRQLQEEFPGKSLVIVSNTAGATSHDRDGRLARELESATGVTVISHGVKKPGCKGEIMAHFQKHPEVGVTHPSQVVIIGDRLMTDMMLANMMGSRGIWIRNGVAPLAEKSMFTKFEYRMASFLFARGFKAPDPSSPFE